MCPRERKNPGKLERKKSGGWLQSTFLTGSVSTGKYINECTYITRMHGRGGAQLCKVWGGGEGQGCSKVTKGLGMTY